MRMRTWALATGLALVVAAGCSRHKQEAVNLSNEADGFVQQDPGSAIAKYEQATKLDPNNHRIFDKLAKAHEKKEEWVKCAQAARRAADLRNANADYWFMQGHCLYEIARKSKKKEDYEKAIKPLAETVKQDDNYDYAYYLLAQSYKWTDDEQKSLQHFKKAIERRPSRVDYYPPWAKLLMDNLYWAEAEQVLKAAKEAPQAAKEAQADTLLTPEKRRNAVFNTHTLLASVYTEKNDVDAEVAELESAKALGFAKNPEILFNLGMAYAKLNRNAQACPMLKKFNKRACHAKKAQKLYASQCAQTLSQIGSLKCK